MLTANGQVNTFLWLTLKENHYNISHNITAKCTSCQGSTSIIIFLFHDLTIKLCLNILFRYYSTRIQIRMIKILGKIGTGKVSYF